MTGRLQRPTTSAGSMFAFPANSELRIAFVPFKVHISFHEGQRLNSKCGRGASGPLKQRPCPLSRVRNDLILCL